MQNTRVPDWQIIQVCPGFVIEMDCNGDGYRRVYPDGRIEIIEQ
jgi:hypothetical protein